jgi:hypothetical protein
MSTIKKVTSAELETRVNDLIAAGYILLNKDPLELKGFLSTPDRVGDAERSLYELTFSNKKKGVFVHLDARIGRLNKAPAYNFLINETRFFHQSAAYRVNKFTSISVVIKRANALGESLALKREEEENTRMTHETNASRAKVILQEEFGGALVVKSADNRNGLIDLSYKGVLFQLTTAEVVDGSARVSIRMGASEARFPYCVDMSQAKEVMDLITSFGLPRSA